MARNTVSRKGPGKTGKKTASAASGTNRTILLILAGFTALVIVAIAAFAILSASGSDQSAENFTPNDQGLIPVGEKAPGFSAETADGSGISLSDRGGKEATMLVFFATWCPHCQAEAPTIAEFVDQYPNLRIVMVGIDGQDDPTKVQEFADEYGIEAPAIYEPSLDDPYGVSGYPTTYILDGKDEVVFAHSGEAPREVFERNIEKALG